MQAGSLGSTHKGHPSAAAALGTPADACVSLANLSLAQSVGEWY